MEGPKPGTTLALLTDEYEMMEHMRDILSKKIELDRKYASDLRAVYDSINPKCKEGPIGSLFTPFISLLKNEYLQREATCEALAEHVAPLPHSSPNHLDEAGVRPSDLYEPLEECFGEASKRHKIAGSAESVSALQEWYEIVAPIESWRACELPMIDRQYRKAVFLQHATVKPSSAWHNSHLPDLIEKHQSTADFIKSKLRNVFDDTINLCAKITRECSSAINAIDRFSSLSFIASKHEMALEEQNHVTLQPFVYHNYWLDGKKSPNPMFGTTREKFYEMANAILDLTDSLTSKGYHRNLQRTCDITIIIEASCQNGVDLKTAVAQSGVFSEKILYFMLLNHDPLIALDEKQLLKFSDGVSRTKIASLLPQDDLAIQFLARISEKAIDTYYYDIALTHDNRAYSILRDIFVKWDFANKRPFPNGVSRNHDGYKVYPRPVFTKTGNPYTPQS